MPKRRTINAIPSREEVVARIVNERRVASDEARDPFGRASVESSPKTGVVRVAEGVALTQIAAFKATAEPLNALGR